MSFVPSSKSRSDAMASAPNWLNQVLGVTSLEEGSTFDLGGQAFVVQNGIPRSKKLVSQAQAQTSETFGFKWKKVDTFDSPASLARMSEWLVERYGDIANASWLNDHGRSPLLVDAGCGAGMSGLELLGPLVPNLRYLGVDVSEAVDVAQSRFKDRGLHAGFLQADISELPLAKESVDLIFSEGVLHHTNSTEAALKSLAKLLKPGGRFLFYVYKLKGPLREFTDDYVREKLQPIPPDQAWSLMEPLTQLGISLGELNAEIDIPHPIDLLGIPGGTRQCAAPFLLACCKNFLSPGFDL